MSTLKIGMITFCKVGDTGMAYNKYLTVFIDNQLTVVLYLSPIILNNPITRMEG